MDGILSRFITCILLLVNTTTSNILVILVKKEITFLAQKKVRIATTFVNSGVLVNCFDSHAGLCTLLK